MVIRRPPLSFSVAFRNIGRKERGAQRKSAPSGRLHGCGRKLKAKKILRPANDDLSHHLNPSAGPSLSLARNDIHGDSYKRPVLCLRVADPFSASPCYLVTNLCVLIRFPSRQIRTISFLILLCLHFCHFEDTCLCVFFIFLLISLPLAINILYKQLEYILPSLSSAMFGYFTFGCFQVTIALFI